MASSKDIEREVETQRAHVESTLDALKQKMSFGQVVDEFGGYFAGEDVKDAVRNVGRQMRDNPVALGLVGVGLAWLMLGGGRSRGDSYNSGGYRGTARGGAGYAGVGQANPGEAGGARYGSAYGSPYVPESSEGVISRASHAIGDAAHTVSDTLSGVKETVAHGVAGAASTLRGAAGTVREAAGTLRGAGEAGVGRLGEAGAAISARLPDRERIADQGRRGVGVLAETLERQPLMVGAFAMAAGVAIGAALPATRTEDRLLGGERDDLVHNARDAVGAMGRQAAEAAKAGLRAATDAAQGEGLAPNPDDKTLAAKVEAAVMAGVDETRRRLDPDTEPGAAPGATPPSL